MNYATIKSVDIANGPGVRVSLFVSGCPHHCKACFNEEAWDYQYGEPFTEETQEHLLSLLAPDYIEGMTLLGGFGNRQRYLFLVHRTLSIYRIIFFFDFKLLGRETCCSQICREI